MDGSTRLRTRGPRGHRCQDGRPLLFRKWLPYKCFPDNPASASSSLPAPRLLFSWPGGNCHSLLCRITIANGAPSRFYRQFFRGRHSNGSNRTLIHASGRSGSMSKSTDHGCWVVCEKLAVIGSSEQAARPGGSNRSQARGSRMNGHISDTDCEPV